MVQGTLVAGSIIQKSNKILKKQNAARCLKSIPHQPLRKTGAIVHEYSQNCLFVIEYSGSFTKYSSHF